MIRFVVIASVFSLCACSDSNSPEVATDTGIEIPLELPDGPNPINCENACKRPPRCEENLGTEQDCLANCNGEANPYKYACCIQYADGCGEVEWCITGIKLTCKEEGTPWVPLKIFDPCSCGDPESPPPNNNECVSQAGDTPCETGMCLKPVNYSEPAFCALECDPTSNPCPEPYKCEVTPKKNYCKPPFG